MSSEPLNGQTGLPSNRRWRPWIQLAVLVLVGLLLVPAVHWRLIGWVKGEAFFQGRPTTYWGRAVARWQKEIHRDDQIPVPAVLRAGPEGIPVHFELLQSSDFNVRYQAAVSLSQPGVDPDQAIPAFIRVLSDENHFMREKAAEVLGNFGEQAREAVPALKAHLGDENEAVGKKAAEALWKIDPKAANKNPSRWPLIRTAPE